MCMNGNIGGNFHADYYDVDNSPEDGPPSIDTAESQKKLCIPENKPQRKMTPFEEFIFCIEFTAILVGGIVGIIALVWFIFIR